MCDLFELVLANDASLNIYEAKIRIRLMSNFIYGLSKTLRTAYFICPDIWLSYPFFPLEKFPLLFKDVVQFYCYPLMLFEISAGPSDAPLASNNFEAFLKVPEFLRPHTQIFCTRY